MPPIGDLTSDGIRYEHRVARYCKPSHPKNNYKKLYEAFLLREQKDPPDEYLSVNWIEYFNKNTVEDALGEICRIMPMKPCIFNPSPNGGFIVLNVACLVDAVYEDKKHMLRVERDPNDVCHESHLGIFVPTNLEKIGKSQCVSKIKYLMYNELTNVCIKLVAK